MGIPGAGDPASGSSLGKKLGRLAGSPQPFLDPALALPLPLWAGETPWGLLLRPGTGAGFADVLVTQTLQEGETGPELGVGTQLLDLHNNPLQSPALTTLGWGFIGSAGKVSNQEPRVLRPDDPTFVRPEGRLHLDLS